MAGRHRSVRTPEALETITRNLALGMSRKAASALAGMSRESLRLWCREDEVVADACEEAEGRAGAHMSAIVADAAFGRPAQYDAMGRLIRKEVPANPEYAWKWLTHRERETYHTQIDIDLPGLAKEVAEAHDLNADELMRDAKEMVDRHRR